MLRNRLNLSYYSLVIFLGSCTSLAWIYVVPTEPFSDFAYYRSIAQEIVCGHPWGTTYTTIGYSIFLAGVYSIFSDTLLIAKVMNIIFYTISNFLFLGILQNSTMPEKIRKLAFGMFVFFPANIFYNSILANETMFTCVLLACIRLYLSEVRLKYFWIGLLTGLNVLIKQQFILFPVVIFIVEQLYQSSFIKNIRNTVVMLVIMCLVISPMIYYNSKMMGQFTSVANNGGIVLYINNNSQNTDGRWMMAEEVENSVVLQDEYITANRTQRNAMLRTAATKWIIDHPREFVILGLLRVKNTFLVGDDICYTLIGITDDEGIADVLTVANGVVKSIFFIPGIIMATIHGARLLSAVRHRKNWSASRVDLILTAVFYMFVLIYFISEGQGRYSYPVTCCMIYLACQAVHLLGCEGNSIPVPLFQRRKL